MFFGLKKVMEVFRSFFSCDGFCVGWLENVFYFLEEVFRV